VHAFFHSSKSILKMSFGNPGGSLGYLVSASIVSTDAVEGQGYTLYGIQVTNRSDGSVWTVFRRFSNFLTLQSHLPKGMVPPECSLHGGVLASSTAPEIVQRRNQLLEDFLGCLLVLPSDNVLAIPELVEFLRLPFSESSAPPSEAEQSWISSTSAPTPQASDQTDFKRLTTVVNKMSEENLNRFLLDLMQRIGHEPIPSANNVYALASLQHLVCVETNSDSACVLHALVHIPGYQSMLRLNNFIRTPTAAGSRLMAFRVAKAICMHTRSSSPSSILLGDDQAVAQFTAWSTRQPLPDRGSVPALAVPIGPQSPLARSVYANSQPAGGHAQSTAALEAREWVAFAASSNDNLFRLPGSITNAAEWTLVSMPKESAKTIIGKLDLRYRVQSTGFGSQAQVYELRLDWHLPTADMEHVLHVLWESKFLGEPVRVSEVPGERANLTETLECEIKDQRRLGGTVTISLVKSCMRSFNGRVVMAATTDPLATTVHASPTTRRIKHLHFLGCEVDVERGIVTACALLSSESIFLVAGDLLGERLMLWPALERLSQALGETDSVTENNEMAEWLQMSSILIG